MPYSSNNRVERQAQKHGHVVIQLESSTNPPLKINLISYNIKLGLNELSKMRRSTLYLKNLQSFLDIVCDQEHKFWKAKLEELGYKF